MVGHRMCFQRKFTWGYIPSAVSECFGWSCGCHCLSRITSPTSYGTYTNQTSAKFHHQWHVRFLFYFVVTDQSIEFESRGKLPMLDRHLVTETLYPVRIAVLRLQSDFCSLFIWPNQMPHSFLAFHRSASLLIWLCCASHRQVFLSSPSRFPLFFAVNSV